MTERKKKIIHMLYGIYVAVFVINAALHLIFACYGIYCGGLGEFSRETVAAQFSKIAIPVYTALALIIGGIILSIALPCSGEPVRLFGKRKKITRDYRIMRDALANKIDVMECNDVLRDEILRERKIRKIRTYSCAGICAVATVPVLINICNPNNYSNTDITESIKSAVISVLAWCVTSLIFCLACNIVNWESLKRECELLKAGRSDGKRHCRRRLSTSSADPDREKKQKIILWSIRGGVLAVAVVFIIIGVFNGGMGDVLAKAIRICTECIGLG